MRLFRGAPLIGQRPNDDRRDQLVSRALCGMLAAPRDRVFARFLLRRVVRRVNAWPHRNLATASVGADDHNT